MDTSSHPATASPELVFASLPDGCRLPVIDVAHPAFAVTLSSAELAELADVYDAESATRADVSDAVRAGLAQSTLGRAVMAASGSYLGGLATYVLKLGPDNLGSCDSPLDRRIAASFPAITVRIRLQDVTGHLAEGLEARLESAGPARPLLLLDVAGGVAAASWNALLQLWRRRPALLTSRAVTIAVLDIDREGPAFGGAAVEALTRPGAPLAGLAITYRHVDYDWSRAETLRAVLDELGAADTVCGASSEGGLFEYGSDEHITANLRTLCAGSPADAIVAGTVTHDGARAKRLTRSGGAATVPRSLEEFARLAGSAGWAIDSSVERPFSRHVRLTKA